MNRDEIYLMFSKMNFVYLKNSFKKYNNSRFFFFLSHRIYTYIKEYKLLIKISGRSVPNRLIFKLYKYIL